jgi:CubicO group peptidase (beta-lactamase class C family)
MLHNLAIYNGTLPDKQVVSRTTLQDMWTTKEKIAGYTTSIGIGWWIAESKKYGKYVFHDGNDPGFCAALIISPANDFGIVILCNALFPKGLIWNKLPFEIMDVFAEHR